MTNVQLILTYGIDKATYIAKANIPNSTTVQFSRIENTRPRVDSDKCKTASVTLNFILNPDKQEITFATEEDQTALSKFATECAEMKKSFAKPVESTAPHWIVPEDSQAYKEDFLNGLTDGKKLDQILKIFADLKTAEAPKTPPMLPITTATQKCSPATGKHPREESESPQSQPKRLSI